MPAGPCRAGLSPCYLLKRLISEYRLTMVFISHDMAVVRHLCSQVVVLYWGHIVEAGATGQVYSAPRHDYTRALLAAVPSVRRARPADERPAEQGPGDA